MATCRLLVLLVPLVLFNPFILSINKTHPMTIQVSQYNTELSITTQQYQLTFMPLRMLALLKHPGGMYYGMSLLSAIDTPTQSDITHDCPKIVIVEQSDQEVLIRLTSDSSIWESKSHFYRLQNDRIDYWTTVQGQGDIERAYYFQGRFQKTPLACIPGFRQIFYPLPNFLERQTFSAGEHVQFPVGITPWVTKTIRGSGLHGAPLCLVMEDDDATHSLSLGLLTKAGDNHFETVDFNYLDAQLSQNPDHCIGTQALSAGYSGHLKVNGQWQSPTLVMRFQIGRTTAMTQYIEDLKQFGGMIERKHTYPDWTYKPVFCTWHEQVAIGLHEGLTDELASPPTLPPGGLFQYCTQANCRKWLDILKTNQINIGSIIIDATWQTHSGNHYVDIAKFPDMRGFIEQCHAENIRVTLWANAWDVAGVPDDECMIVDGKPLAADPTNPAYLKRIDDFVQHMLGSDPNCLNADGIKLDGMTNVPHGPEVHSHTGTSGFELARAMMEAWSNAIRKIKPQAALGLYTAFPYFSDIPDVLRTGDLYTVKGDPLSANRFRAQVIRYSMPDIAIDTDGAQRFNCVLPFKTILQNQKEIGVPCLYQAQWLVQRRDFALPFFTKLNASHYKDMKQYCE